MDTLIADLELPLATNVEARTNAASPADLRLATVTVTYNPDIDILRRQLLSIPREFLRIVVDNGSRLDVHPGIQRLAEDSDIAFVGNQSNQGLPAALNQGIALAVARGCEAVLLLDQDTEPDEGAVRALVEARIRLSQQGQGDACLGPRLIDATTGMDYGFHRIRGWRIERIIPDALAVEPIPCDSLNGSGTLIPISLLSELGELDEALFIDHVDTEWAFRVRACGHPLLGIPNSRFAHRMGDDSKRFWLFGWRVWPLRSPLRHYYLFRNAIALIKRPYVPITWKFWVLPKLVLTMAVFCCTGTMKEAQLRAMIKGLHDGIAGRLGPK